MELLFIGNSYTRNLKAPFIGMMQEVAPEATLQFKMAGGCTLARHVADPAIKQAIDTHPWDLIVLQEQSRLPTFATDSKSYQAHREAIRTLAGWSRARGATPILYQTWGRRDGDSGSPQRSPDFDAMQAHLTRAYHDAGADIAARVIPVGEIWQAVRQADPLLGALLHAPDGSHASERGSYLIAATFLRALLGKDAATLQFAAPMSPAEAAVIHRAISAGVAAAHA